ncbi:MAG: beta-galactosidase GanA [Cyclobacteriaceae bacterium]|jgi:beta-galactosidase GanA
MKKIYLGLILGLITIAGIAQSSLPNLQNNQLIVDGKPFIMIAGELHNSSASSAAYMEDVWPKLQSLNLNTVLASVSWDQFEPEEGKFDYKMIDYLIANAEKNQMKLVIIWFASWKNGQSSYAPLWVKKDTKRFPRVKNMEGKLVETLSVFSNETRNADAKAFAALIRRIKEIDKNNTVIMMQPENEVGIFQDIDYNKFALAEYSDNVPPALMTYLKKNKKNLNPEVRSVWEKAGLKTSGTWKNVFGDNPQSKEFLMSWKYASYMNYVAEAGRKELDLPMFVNAWIVQKEEDLPGVYPNGGPVSRVMDIYKAAAPSIDIICPDIYLPNYKEIYAMYDRADNPLLVPESSLDPARAFYAFAEHDAICFSPFGIEDAAGDVLYSKSYEVLNELMPIITKYQGTGKMRGIHLTKEEQDQEFLLGDLTISLKIQDADKPAFGLIIMTDEREFLVSGMNFKVIFKKSTKKGVTYVGKVTEGDFVNGSWVEKRWMNGDETYHHELVRILGDRIEGGSQFQFEKTNLDVSEGEQFVYSPGSVNAVIVPATYKIQLYDRPE